MRQLYEILDEMKKKIQRTSSDAYKLNGLSAGSEKGLTDLPNKTTLYSYDELFFTKFLLLLESEFQNIYGDGATATKLHDGNFETWISILCDLMPFQLEHGIERLTKTHTKHRQFPPNSLEFRDLCLDTDLKLKQSGRPGDDLPKVPLWLGLTDKIDSSPVCLPNLDGSDAGTRELNAMWRKMGRKKLGHRDIPHD